MHDLTPATIFFNPDKDMPNNQVFPVLIYRHILSENLKASFKMHFVENGWGGIWENGIFDYHHYHPDAHEALGVACGKAMVILGGESGETYTFKAGDLIVLPAGTGHKCISASDDFCVIGAYPKGQEGKTICRSIHERANVLEEIKAMPIPEKDPLFGESGPLLSYWIKE